MTAGRIAAVAVLEPPHGPHGHVRRVMAEQLPVPARIGTKAGRMSNASRAGIAVADAILGGDLLARLERRPLGLFHGTALGCAESNDLFHRGVIEQGMAGASPRRFVSTVPSAVLGEISLAWGLRGPMMVAMAGRASGVEALASALSCVQSGEIDAALVLGGDVLGPARAAAMETQRGNEVHETWVAVLVQSSGEVPGPQLTHATTRRTDRAGTPPAVDRLGATGLYELARWFEQGAAAPLHVEGTDADGFAFVLDAVGPTP